MSTSDKEEALTFADKVEERAKADHRIPLWVGALPAAWASSMILSSSLLDDAWPLLVMLLSGVAIGLIIYFGHVRSRRHVRTALRQDPHADQGSTKEALLGVTPVVWMWANTDWGQDNPPLTIAFAIGMFIHVFVLFLLWRRKDGHPA